MPTSTFRTFVGIAKETTRATAVTTPAFYIPVTKYEPEDKYNYLVDDAWRGSNALDYSIVQANRWAELQYGGDMFADAIGFPLAGILGDIVTTGTGSPAAAPYTTALSVLNTGNGQPPSYTMVDANGVSTRALRGVQAEEVSINLSPEALVKYDVKAKGYLSQTVPAPTASLTQLAPVPAWQFAASVGGTALPTVMSMECALKRKLEAIFTMGQQDPYSIFASNIEVTGKMKVVMEDESQLAHFLTNDQPALDFTFTQGTGATQTGVKIHGSKVAYTTGKIDRGKDFQALDIDLKFMVNPTDAGASGGLSPVKVTLTNGITGLY